MTQILVFSFIRWIWIVFRHWWLLSIWIWCAARQTEQGLLRGIRKNRSHPHLEYREGGMSFRLPLQMVPGMITLHRQTDGIGGLKKLSKTTQSLVFRSVSSCQGSCPNVAEPNWCFLRLSKVFILKHLKRWFSWNVFTFHRIQIPRPVRPNCGG